MKYPLKKMLQDSNQLIVLFGCIFSLCIVAAFSATVYIMLAKKHLLSGHNALDPVVSSSFVTETVPGVRGTIYDQNGQVLAQQTTAYTIVANFDTRSEEEKEQSEASTQQQRQAVLAAAQANGTLEQVQAQLDAQDAAYVSPYVEDINAFADALVSVLGDSVNKDTLVSYLQQGQEDGRAQIELGPGTKRLDREAKEKLEAMKIPGLSFTEDFKRTYPTTPFASQLIGFAAYNDDTGTLSGRMGLEQSLDSYLSGEDGSVQYQATQSGEMLPDTEVTLKEAVNGYDVTLTIDASLQSTVEEQMKKTMEDNKAQYAWCVVMEPSTGKILAYGSYPDFNQNNPVEIPSYIDHVAQYPYEPGSVVKPLIYAMAIDAGVYPEDGEYRAGSFTYTLDPVTQKIIRLTDGEPSAYPTIYDALGTDFGTLSFADGLAHSSNIAICELLSNYLDKETFQKYADAFHLYQNTGIDYVSEQSGTENIWDPSSYLSSGFGQASSMTVLDLCEAFTAIFNNGVMMKPYVVSSITDPADHNAVLQKFEPTVAGTPISAQTAQKVCQLMKGVVAPDMTGERFAMDGVDLAVKTGTGEIYNTETGAYDRVNYTSSVMAAAPADDPKVMVYWGMVSPNYLNYSEEPFKAIMKQALITTNVNTSSASQGTSESSTEVFNEWQTYEMPSLINHSLSYAQQKMEDKTVNTIVIGDGTSVIDQFPPAGTSISSNDNILLLTNGSNITMPDMIGWTRKDITAFWQLSGIPVRSEGTSKVTWQSIEAGTPISTDTEIVVRLDGPESSSSDANQDASQSSQ